MPSLSLLKIKQTTLIIHASTIEQLNAAEIWSPYHFVCLFLYFNIKIYIKIIQIKVQW